MSTSNEQDVFASGAYWREYYASLGHENRVAGEFLLQTTTALSAGGRLRLLDAGCGPTLLYWAVFASGANEFHGFDINPANIRDIEQQIEGIRQGTFDPNLVDAARHAVRLTGGSDTPRARLAERARQVGELKLADLSVPWPYQAVSFDLVQSFFALECLPDWASLEAALAEAERVLRPGGRLALVNVARGTRWVCDGQSFQTLHITSDRMIRAIERSGLSVISALELASSDQDWRPQGYGAVLLTCAAKLAKN